MIAQRDDYRRFLEAKAVAATSSGFEVEDSEINPILKPHQRATVRWALHGGRRAIFAAFGLGKSVIQIEIIRLVLKYAGGRGLIVAPLGVRQEFMRDAAMLGVSIRFIRSIDEADETGIHLTNYETVRDGKLDPRHFMAASLDEASCLRGFGGTKTFREFMRLFAGDGKSLHKRVRGAEVLYRFVATATPSPNDYIELLAYSAYLGVMDVSAAKTRFFKRNSEKADQLTIHPHKEREFWLWVATWALFIQRPSDLGFDDSGYALPPMEIRWHEVPTDHVKEAGSERDGQARMFANASVGVSDAARTKRESLGNRIAKLLELRAENPDGHRVIWHDLEAERFAIERALPSVRFNNWEQYRDGHPRVLELYERHYSAYEYADGRDRDRIIGPGERIVLLSRTGDALFGWRKFIDDSGQTGVNCAVFRNEGEIRSSDLIKEAMAIAWLKWPGERLYTYVDPSKIRSSIPGYCFIRAGWRKCKQPTKGGLLIFEALPNRKVANIVATSGAVSIYGSQDLDEREQAIIDFSDGRIRELAAKPVIAGSGCNFQRHCSHAVFLGIGFKFNDFIQAIHRIYRFLQPFPVRIDLIYSEAERGIRRILEEKWKRHDEMVKQMSEIIREYGLSEAAMADALKRSIGVERVEVGGAGFRLINADAVEEARRMEMNSVDLLITSVPFATQYEYTPSYNDFGHTDTNAHFWAQMDFLTPELLRVLRPGRVAAIHVKDRIVPGGLTGLGFQTVNPFHSEAINHYRNHGFAFLGMKTVVTDVVRENNQTYRLGWTEQCKDGSKMGAGLPEYVLLFRKPPTDSSNGYADRPVRKAKKLATRDGWENPAGYSRARWQLDAHGFMRSSGDRLLSADELEGLPADQVFRIWREYSASSVYDFEHHVKIGEALELRGALPPTFMLLPPHSWHPDVWTDVTRMLTLNGQQYAAGKEMHLCPLQFDVVDRLITQFSEEGETVYDPFGGLMTVPYRAIKLRRQAIATELNPGYFLDGVGYVKAAVEEMDMPSLFDFIEAPDPTEAVA